MEQNILAMEYGLVYALIVLVFIFAAKKIDDWRTRDFDDDHEVVENSNAAVGLRRSGLYLGLAAGMTGALYGESQGLAKDAMTLAWEGVVIVLLLFVSRALCDLILLKGVDNDGEVKNGNAAVGFMELGIYLASGLVLSGAFSGEGGGLISALVFFALGQLMLIILFYLYEMISSYNIVDEIKSSNAAAGLSAAGTMIALGLILRASVSGPAVDWVTDLTAFGISAASGIIMLLVFKKIIDLLLLPGTSLKIEIERDGNLAAAALTEGAIIALALIISAVL